VGTAEYLIRLDDACPTMDHERWAAVERVLDSHGVAPIVGIVPDNADPVLAPCPPDSRFWDAARAWQKRGWHIALHGYRHQLRVARRGLVPVGKFAEFTGLPWSEQRQRIRDGVRILRNHDLSPRVWVAPAHGFDLATLQALREESSISVISDGFSRRPYRHLGFTWLPQQLWRPRRMGSGLWTICLHPNAMQGSEIDALDRFLSSRPGGFPTVENAATRAVPFGAEEVLFRAAFTALLTAKSLLRGRK
jgi:predicted deacetylase